MRKQLSVTHESTGDLYIVTVDEDTTVKFEKLQEGKASPCHVLPLDVFTQIVGLLDADTTLNFSLEGVGRTVETARKRAGSFLKGLGDKLGG